MRRKKGHLWVDTHRQGETIEIILRDSTRAKIDSWKININDKKRARQIIKDMNKRYGIDFGFDLRQEKDMDWLP